MCGIAGVVRHAGVGRDDEAVVARMLEAVAHRGPDDQYAVSLGRAVIGSRRLSIIDLDTGRQPLSNEDGTVWVSQNGEIYNYLELREELERRGHAFRTSGDTEVIAHLYEEHGERFVERLRGMFAVAIWDGRNQRLVLARDRLGKKPLYWRAEDGRLTYGSELKCILADACVPREVDPVALALYLQYQYVPDPRSILRGVAKLPPASVLVWDGTRPQIETYWRPSFEKRPNRSIDDDRDECVELLREAVRLRLRSDVPVGVFLSGGMDSSLVTALMAEASAEPVRTYSIGFAEQAFNELPHARAIADRFGTRHTEDIVNLGAIDLLPALVHHYDEPFGDSSAVPTFRVAQLAARDVKVVLTGDGGDEAFGGYDRYRLQIALDAVRRFPPPLRDGIVGSAQFLMNRRRPARGGPRSDWVDLARMPGDVRYARLMSIFSPPIREELFCGDPLADQDAYLLDVLRSGPDRGPDRLLRADALTYLPNDLLVKMDRATMANSLEARSPLLDHVLVEFAARLPASRKIAGLTSKAILRRIARDLLPSGHLDRPKMGFALPVGSWFHGTLGDVFADTVLAPDARLRDFVDRDVAARLFADHRASIASHAPRLWSLLVFELWARTWLGVSASDAA